MAKGSHFLCDTWCFHCVKLSSHLAISHTIPEYQALAATVYNTIGRTFIYFTHRCWFFCTSVQNVTAGILTTYMTNIFFIVMVLWIELRTSYMFVLYIPRFRLALNSLPFCFCLPSSWSYRYLSPLYPHNDPVRQGSWFPLEESEVCFGSCLWAPLGTPPLCPCQGYLLILPWFLIGLL